MSYFWRLSSYFILYLLSFFPEYLSFEDLMDNESLIVMQTKDREVNKSDENSTNEEEDLNDFAVDSDELNEAEVEENYDRWIEGIVGNKIFD